mgnify:CR=1 FL=1
MLRVIISLLMFLASVILPLQVGAFSVFDEGKISQNTREKLNKSSSEVDFLNRVYFDILSQDTYNSNDAQNELIRTSARVDLVSQLYYDKKWFIYTNFRVNEQGLASNEFNSIQVTPENNNDQFLSSHNGVIRELNFGYEDDDYKVFAGKFRPKFGYAWNLGRGVFTNSLSSSYMQSERIGFGGEVKAGDKERTGGYNLGLSVYKYDRKYLDNLLSKGSLKVRVQKRALALKKLDEGMTYQAVSNILEISYPTILNWAKKYRSNGLVFLKDKPRSGRPITPLQPWRWLVVEAARGQEKSPWHIAESCFLTSCQNLTAGFWKCCVNLWKPEKYPLAAPRVRLLFLRGFRSLAR